LPALSSGHITFGCLNNFAKVSPPLTEIWRRLLANVPDSVLVLHSHEGQHRRRLADSFARIGVDPRRIRFVDRLALPDYFQQYNQIDIALDTYPYGGGATTLDALWMGVPVISLAGETAVSRAGSSILSNAGLPELAASEPEKYIRIAADLARDLPRLKGVRESLRRQLEDSRLMEAAAFARDVEHAFRQMWVHWVGS
jgi:predicted O-linked N-acetylglucosamine transferase (SPINDLY family)